jgi:adenosylcobinamide-phosphate synthase
MEKFLGVLLGLTVIATFALPLFFGLFAIYTFTPFYVNILVYGFIAVILVKMTICIKLETDWAKAAAKAIDESNLPEAKKYSHFSRRESKDLNGAQMGSAVIESMSENLIDFKLSPMMSFSLFGVTGAITFRAINTLDGMVGFKNKEHINTGWFSANLDNFVNFIPTRLTALLMIVAAAILRMDAKNAWRIACRDHKKTPSRNHGWPMAAVAGALRIQLEKPGQYILGDAQEPLTGEKILGALRIRDVTIILWGLLCVAVIVMVRLFWFIPI